MISATSIRKAFKLAVYDPKDKGTEFYIEARDMTSNAHFQRARMLITFYFDGVRDETAILHALWHLACGVAKLEEVHTERPPTGRS